MNTEFITSQEIAEIIKELFKSIDIPKMNLEKVKIIR